LLRPVSVGDTGYRRYSTAQVRTGQLIGLLRSAGLPLSDIAAVLDDLGAGADAAAARLDALATEMNRRHGDHLLVIRHVQATLKGDDDPMFPVHTRHVPATRVMSIQRRLHAAETDGFVREAKATFAAHLGTTPATGPFILIFHGVVDAESDGPLEAVLGCTETVAPTDEIGIRTEPAHDEAYTTITKAQWAYPAILAAYDAVACSPEAKVGPGSRLSCREIYLAEPDTIGDEELVCDIAFPLGAR
jgi:DNA-binding transcriptional MerR regulator